MAAIIIRTWACTGQICLKVKVKVDSAFYPLWDGEINTVSVSLKILDISFAIALLT